jgi:hypothetical protein
MDGFSSRSGRPAQLRRRPHCRPNRGNRQESVENVHFSRLFKNFEGKAQKMFTLDASMQ